MNPQRFGATTKRPFIYKKGIITFNDHESTFADIPEDECQTNIYEDIDDNRDEIIENTVTTTSTCKEYDSLHRKISAI